MIGHILSVDPGKRQDPAALCALKLVWTYASPGNYLERHPKMPAMEEMFSERSPKRVEQLIVHLRMLDQFYDKKYRQLIRATDYWMRRIESEPDASGDIALVVDSTGLGDPVVEMMEEAGFTVAAPLLITTGQTVKEPSKDDDRWHVPRTNILTEAQLWWEAGRIRVPPPAKLPMVKELEDQLRSLHPDPKRKPRAGEVIVADEEHDDLAMVVGQALWWLSRIERPTRIVAQVLAKARKGRYDPLRGTRR